MDAGELEEALVQWAGVVVFAVPAREGRATFVEHARQDNVAAQAHARTARRSFGQIRRVDSIAGHNFDWIMFSLFMVCRSIMDRPDKCRYGASGRGDVKPAESR